MALALGFTFHDLGGVGLSFRMWCSGFKGTLKCRALMSVKPTCDVGREANVNKVCTLNEQVVACRCRVQLFNTFNTCQWAFTFSDNPAGFWKMGCSLQLAAPSPFMLLRRAMSTAMRPIYGRIQAKLTEGLQPMTLVIKVRNTRSWDVFDWPGVPCVMFSRTHEP